MLPLMLYIHQAQMGDFLIPGIDEEYFYPEKLYKIRKIFQIFDMIFIRSCEQNWNINGHFIFKIILFFVFAF